MKQFITLVLLSFLFTGCYTTLTLESDHRTSRSSSTVMYLNKGISPCYTYTVVNPYPYYYVNQRNCSRYYYSEYYYVGQNKHRTNTYSSPKNRVRSSGLSNNGNRRSVRSDNRNRSREVTRTRSTRVERSTRVQRSSNDRTRKNSRKKDN